MSTLNAADTGEESAATGGVVLIVAAGDLARIVVNRLAGHFDKLTVLQEEPETKLAILRRRMRLIGPVSAVGQAACGVLLKFIAKASRGRINEICAAHDMDRSANRNVEIRQIGTVNSDAARDALHELQPRVVAVYGTRLIRRKTRESVTAPFINYHAGINPKYRGQQPGYWALVENDPEHAGVTIHIIDEGVDTGDVLYQSQVNFSAGDNITTYQFVQMATALPLYIRAIEDALGGTLAPRRVDLPSRLWFPPTIWGYLWSGLSRRVW